MLSLGLRLTLFTVAMLALGGVLLYPAATWGGAPSQYALAIAWALSVIPGWIVLTGHALVKTPQQGVFLALGSNVGRLLFVGLGALFILTQRQLPEQQFAVWVVVCYLAALLIETSLVLQPGAAKSAIAAPRTWTSAAGWGSR